ncbi:sulfatase-like hydrolase/transferase [Verrucomicrobiaceae bacterium N1E253]|uniref:Sulfatase-like hydrolase/transferase n=1 Tax=Oceaniferula marina TaxID=2748318 RepID=A0A851GB42_9BACT|nr:sulfatase-like hydrolase/transferase [Oceaniferula marina]NWK54636.1 sulfatase-like hydrolase/transferase [Oceaniferula marina]
MSHSLHTHWFRSFSILSLLTVLCLSLHTVSAASPKQPNILFILLDDLGKEWVDCYGAEGIELPNINKLADSGMQFSNAYSMPQCTPSRVTLLTGQYPYTHGWVNHWDVPRWGGGCHFDPAKNPSLPRVLKKAGYATAAAGKWQIDDFRVEPEAMQTVGFDDYCMWTGYEAGVKASSKRYWDPYIHTRSGSKTYPGQFGEDIFTDFLISFMKKNKDKPMFLYYPMCLPHGPLTTTPLEKSVKGKENTHRAMVRYTDHILGKLMASLDDLGIRENTIVIWTTDNGTSGSLKNTLNGRLVKGGKTKTTENGINAPFIVNCPGRVPKGKTTDALIDFADLLPTFAELAGTQPSSKFQCDGVSFAKLLLGQADDSPRTWILGMGGRNEARLTADGVQNKYRFRDRVVRNKRYKLYFNLERKPVKLVDLKTDPGEQTNLIERPELQPVIKELQSVEKQWPDEDKAPVYTPNPPQKWDVKIKK